MEVLYITHLRQVEPIVGDSVSDEKDFDVVKLEDGIDECRRKGSGCVGQRRRVEARTPQ